MKRIKSLAVVILFLVVSVLSVFALVGCNKSDPSSGSSTEPPVVNNNPIDNLVFVELSSESGYGSDAEGTYGVKTTNKNIEGALVIPAEYNGKAVTVVLKEGFRFCDKLTSVIMPRSVKVIGTRAFEGCSGLTSVTVYPLDVINFAAFKGCGELDFIWKCTEIIAHNCSLGNDVFLNTTCNYIYQPEE